MKSIGLARIGRDAEIRFLPDGTAVCNLSLATNYGKKGEDGKRPTQWIDASLWGKQAEALAPYLVKGSVHCFVLDEIHLETYPKNGGGEGVKIVARVDSVELGPRDAGATGQSEAPARQAAPAGQRPAPKPAPNFSDMDDEIPF